MEVKIVNVINDYILLQATSVLKSGKISQLLDPSLGSEYNNCQIKRMVLAATLCIRRVPRLRPQIGVVSPFPAQIHSILFVPPCMSFGYQSYFFNNADTETSSR